MQAHGSGAGLVVWLAPIAVCGEIEKEERAEHCFVLLAGLAQSWCRWGAGNTRGWFD